MNDLRQENLITPPEHITPNHIYSSAYRRAEILGCDKPTCQSKAREATNQFRALGKVNRDMVGAFANKPRKGKGREA